MQNEKSGASGPDELRLTEASDVGVVLQKLLGNTNRITDLPRTSQLIESFLSEQLLGYIDALKDRERKDRSHLPSFFLDTDNFVKQCHVFEKQLDSRPLIKRIQQLFRSSIKPWCKGNDFMQRCLEKPQGYPGDYFTLEMIYDYQMQPIEKHGLFDHYLLRHANCVRSRKEKLKLYLNDFLNRFTFPNNDRIFSQTWLL